MSGDVGVDPTHGGNHAPLPEGVRLDPGYCAGCDGGNLDVVAALDRALSAWEARGPTSLTTALLVEAAYAARAALGDPS